MRVALIGYGAIGSRVARGILGGTVPGVSLAGVHTRTPGRAASDGIAELSEAGLAGNAHLVVECAGRQAAAELGPKVIAAGRDLLLTSAGALADESIRHALLGGPGRTYLTSGAIGGLDLLAAAGLGGGLDSASLTTAKLPATLIQPWMSENEAAAIRGTDDATEIFCGSVAAAVDKFPQSLNVAVALAHATGLWAETEVRLIADPDASQTRHVIEAAGSAGRYQFTIENTPLADNPATSGIVADAVLKSIGVLAGRPGAVV